MKLGMLALAVAGAVAISGASIEVHAQTSVVGCSDGAREGFSNQTTYPLIASCGGAWTVPGVFKDAPACDRAAGNTGSNSAGTGCNVEDLCGVGWHVCYGPDDIAVRTGGRGCTDSVASNYPNSGNGTTGTGTPGGAFFMTRTSGSGTGNCDEVVNGLPQSFNDIFGCGNLGDFPQSNCAPLNRFGHNQCQGVQYSAPYGGSPATAFGFESAEWAWSCHDGSDGTNESKFVTKRFPLVQGGVMCCKDTGPGLPEICDHGIDNNENGVTDEAPSGLTGIPAGSTPGMPCTATGGAAGTVACNGQGGWKCDPVPAQSCCLPGSGSISCQNLAPTTCTAQGGTPGGSGTTCANNPCPACYVDASPNDGDIDVGCSTTVNACEERGNADACVDCLNDTDCNVAGGDVCRTSSDTCVACIDNQSGATRDHGCEVANFPGKPLCDDSNLAAPVCVECEDTNVSANTTPDAGCVAAQPACRVNAPGGPDCVECLVDGHCGAGRVCNTTTFTCHPCYDSATFPTNDAGCATAALPICEVSLSPRSCVECRNTASAGSTDEGCSAALPACDVSPTGTPNDCVECLANADCTDTGEVCDVSTKTCVPCLTDATVGNIDQGCAAVLNACKVQPGDDVCVDCLATGDCSISGDVCNTTTNACAPCIDNAIGGTRDLGCESGQPPLCNDNGPIPTCVTCEDSNPAATPTPDDGCAAGLPACNVAAVGGATCVQCLADGHCTNGKVCDTTTNTCVPCQNTQSGATRDNGCTVVEPICNEVLDPNECVSCLNDSTTGAVPDTGCSALLPACDAAGVTTTVCVECLQDADCFAGEVCDEANRACVPCVDNLPISSLPTPDEGCNSGAPLCELSSGGNDPTECVVCQQTVPTDDVDPGCTAGAPDCSITGVERRCLGCLTDNDCIGDQICHEGACVACVDTAVYSAIDKGCDTAERICHLPAPTQLSEPTNLVGDTCVSCRDDKGVALVDTGCTAETPICDALRQTGEVCVECLVDADCAPLGAVCDETNNTCVLCVDSAPLTGQDDGCTVADPICDDRGAADTETCESCLDTVPLGQDLGCNPTLPVCDEAAPGGHTCVECTNDSDCGLGESCQQASKTCAACFDDATYPALDTGCNDDTPLCVEQGIISGGGSTVILSCVVCADTDPTNASADEGCPSLTPNCNENVPGGTCTECNDASDCGAGQACDIDTGNCVACIDDRLAGTVDSGCTAALPVCAIGSGATLADDVCVACEDDKSAGLRDWGCSNATPFCNEAAATPVCVTCETDADCEGQLVCNAGACADPGVTSAADDRYTTTEGVTLTVSLADGLADNDQWPPGSDYAITVDGNGPSAAEGTLVLAADGSFTFIPAPGFAGNVVWSYKITAAINGASATATVNILVNGPPRAADDVVSTNQATPAQFDPRANDTDPNGGALTITRIVSGPSHGAATLSTTITYTPDPEYSGSDTIVYEVCDETNLCDTATIAITVIDVNDPPLAGDDFVSTPEDTGVVAVVLANDRDNDSAVLDVRRIMDPPLHGTVSIEADDSIRYLPDPNYNGRDAFTYEVCDSQGQCDVAAVIVTVTPVNDPPRAGDDQTTTPAGTQVIIPVIGNDSDVDGDALAIARIVQQPASGTTRIEADGSITYTPAGNTTGLVIFSYEVCDLELCDIAEVRVTVGVDNDPPTAVNDLVTTGADEPVVIDVLANDSDADGDPLTLTQVGLSTSGTALIADGEVLFTPSRGFVGDATFTYTICDDRGACSTALVTVAVLTGGNRPPLATDDVASTSVNTSVNLDPTLNDVDLDNDPIAVEDIATQPLHGTAVLEADGTVTYTPAPGYVGTDTFIVSVTDGFGGFDESRVTVFVTDGGNEPPVAVDDDYEVSTEAAAVLDVLGNDSDPDGDALVIVEVVQGQKGVVTVVVEGGATTLVYTPKPGASGTDTFTYTVSDGKGGTDTATVTVEFPVGNGRPDAIGESVSTPEDTAIVVVVLANDSDPDGDAIELASIEVEPRHGTVVIEGDVVRYTPAANYVGNDAFTYRMCDGNGACDTAVVGVVVTPVNDPPVANDDSYAVSAAGVATLPVTLNDIDPEQDALTVSIVTQPGKGSVTVAADGSIGYTPSGTGSDTFTYRACDPSGACDLATVEIEIGGANRNPVALDDAAETAREEPVTIDVLANDSDADGDALIVSAVEDPEHGIATIEDNEVVYTPDADFSGSETFFYTACDPSGACATAYVVVEVIADGNTPPVAIDDTVQTQAGTPVRFDSTANDFDADGDDITVTGTSTPAHGTVSLNGDGTITYTPDPGYTGSDTFTVTVTDGNGGTATQSVWVIVTAGDNDPPDAIDDVYDVGGGVPTSLAVLVNDSDPDGDALAIVDVVQPRHGTANIDSSGNIVYTPEPGYVGADRFSYTVSDGKGGYDTAFVDVYVGDRDHDGLGDEVEVIIGTDPDAPDTDGDGIDDGVEVGGGEPGVYEPGTDTNPLDADSDDDGLSDGDEVEAELDPLDDDSDDDGIKDGTEVGVTEPVPSGTTPGGIVFEGSGEGFVPDADPTTTTDPKDDDSDDDGLTDGFEDANANGAWDGSVGGTGTAGSGETDASNADTDGDGLQDGTELGLTEPQGNGTDLTKFKPDLDPSTTTDPRDTDTDDGGVGDGVEDKDKDGFVDPDEINPNSGSDDQTVAPPEEVEFIAEGGCGGGALGLLVGLLGLAVVLGRRRPNPHR